MKRPTVGVVGEAASSIRPGGASGHGSRRAGLLWSERPVPAGWQRHRASPCGRVEGARARLDPERRDLRRPGRGSGEPQRAQPVTAAVLPSARHPVNQNAAMVHGLLELGINEFGQGSVSSEDACRILGAKE